ncbi:rRNA methyltransferase [Clostridia bacterium]|nr:rRNA methyltransferase [Clostridia bacterium]
MRVITGTARGRKLKTLENKNLDTGEYDVRPTSDGVKEAIFSAVQFDIEDETVIDLFAGSGQLGIEALSRGALKAVFTDNNPAAIAVIKDNLAATGFTEQAEIRNSPCSAYLKSTAESFGIAFADPPYGRGHIEKILPVVMPKMNGHGIIVCEHEKELSLPEYGGWAMKLYRHGKTSVTIYRKEAQTEQD